ncbi:MAG: radical SAM protein [Candidatus Aegiribacteria sp.]|nr:radical SAM protein [Candidatus Aegiribacteria sp.]
MHFADPIIVFEVTSRCNLKCRFCYNVWKSSGYSSPVELPLAKIALLADSIEAAHPVSVALTGGEPLLREDLSSIAMLFRSRGIKVGVVSNGILLDKESAEKLADAGVSWFDISVPSISFGGYKRLTGFDGFAKVKRAMLAVKSAGARLIVSHIMTALNEGEAGKVIELAFAFSADAVALNRFVPGGEGHRNPDLIPTLQQLDNSLSAASKAASSLGITVYASIPVEDCLLQHERYPGIEFGSCVCGERKWAVDPSGGLRICEQSPGILGSLLESSFENLIESPAVAEFRRKDSLPDCGECPAYGECGGGCRFI